MFYTRRILMSNRITQLLSCSLIHSRPLSPPPNSITYPLESFTTWVSSLLPTNISTRHQTNHDVNIVMLQKRKYIFYFHKTLTATENQSYFKGRIHWNQIAVLSFFHSTAKLNSWENVPILVNLRNIHFSQHIGLR